MPVYVHNKHHYQGSGIYIGRPGPLGNPYSHRPSKLPGTILVSTREEAVEKYKDWLREQWSKAGPARRELERLVKLYKQTGRLDLICWCSPAPCHGDFLAEVIETLSRIE